jgi:hypothetical protein
MTLSRALIALLAVAVVHGGGLAAQTNNNAYTPLGSRIRHDRAFPNEPRATFDRQVITAADRQRSRTMGDTLARCLWNRGNEKGLDLLARSDLGFVQFEQIGLTSADMGRLYPIGHCLSNVAERHNTGVVLRFSPAGIRQSYLQAAYLDMYPDGPTWLQSGAIVAERSLPLSQGDVSVQTQLAYIDCVVLTDPVNADYLFRTAAGSDTERSTLQALVPAFSACLPEGVEFEIDPQHIRILMGEGLWHAARNSAAPEAASPAQTSEESQ